MGGAVSVTITANASTTITSSTAAQVKGDHHPSPHDEASTPPSSSQAPKTTPTAAPANTITENDNILRSRLHGLRHLLNQSGIKDAFCRFLCMEKMSDDLATSATKVIQSTQWTEEMSSFVNDLIESIRMVMLEDVLYRTSLGAALATSSMQPIVVLAIAMHLYPKFLKSNEYKRTKETGSNKQMQNNNEKRRELMQQSFMNPVEMKIAQKAISTVDLQEVERLLQSGCWLTSMLAAVENLPVCVSISTASKERPGFPLIYVNACFEKTTGYSRNEIVGQNCRFLQAGKAEQEAIDRLSTALKEAKPVRVAITNFRKDGMPFKNLLAMKPIFSENGSYEYVVGVQFDVTQDDATPDKLKLAEQVMEMLPNTIQTDIKANDNAAGNTTTNDNASRSTVEPQVANTAMVLNNNSNIDDNDGLSLEKEKV